MAQVLVDTNLADQRKKLYQAMVEDPTGTRSQDWYTQNAELYEQEHKNQGFMYHKECVKIFTETVLQKDCKIIDFAMGTGFIGDMLRNEGYTGQIDGMDRNPAMLKFAKDKGVYTNIWTVNIGKEKINEIDDDSYDNGVVAGSVGRGQVEFTALPTMMRAIKNGGYLVVTMSHFHTQYEDFTIKALENLSEKWNNEGLCHLVQCVERMHTSTAGGYVFVLRRGSKE